MPRRCSIRRGEAETGNFGALTLPRRINLRLGKELRLGVEALGFQK